MTHTPHHQPGFTLLEVVLSLSISAMLFLGVSSVLSASLSYSRDVTGVVRFRQEQQRVYLALRNAFAESDKMMFTNVAPNPRIILRNKSTSSLRPFTLIENPATTGGATDNRLIIQDFTLDPTVSPTTPTTAARQSKNVTAAASRVVTLNPATNQVTIGNNATVPCTSAFTSPCILFNYKNNTLDFGITGNAPFVGAPLITDIRVDTDTNYVDVLSPYEKREYKIRVNGGVPSATFTALPAGNGEFPYYYVGTTPTTPNFSSSTSLADTPPATKPFQVTGFAYLRDIATAPASSTVQIDKVTLTLTDLTNTTRTATIVIPVIVNR